MSWLWCKRFGSYCVLEASPQDVEENADQSSSSEESKSKKEQAEKQLKEQESREEVMEKSKKVLAETRAYVQHGSKNDGASSRDQESDIHDGWTNSSERTKDYGSYTYSDDENNNLDESEKDGNTSSEFTINNDPPNHKRDREDKASDDSSMLRSYSSIEYVERMGGQ